ncbi:hypothetical protein [uncultured Methanolobus sp.]|uniref:hypothetical protein n=1 Tax=uncultured Methanolobus sp. TaxID=218300 RepID=UPI0029C9A358|nr:hypothetical protein [uncultured Methanolobus sp.]
MVECELLSKCGFFKKYSSEKQAACKGFIALYCKGPNMNKCKRKAYRKENGAAPSDDMMPTGSMILN